MSKFNEGYVLFSGPDCSNCTALKKKLSEAGVPITEYNIREDEEARNFILGLGFRSIPQLFFNGEKLPNNKF